MNSQRSRKNLVIQLVSYLFVLLFVYAAISKLLDFQNFHVQLSQSPLLSVFSSWIAVLVPIAELFTAILLIVPSFRLWGFYFSLILMGMFTVYIYIILHFSSFIPCSCGGVLEKMSWNVHLLFNLIFIVLAIWAILLCSKGNESNNFIGRHLKHIKIICFCLVFSAVSITMLFLSSENIMHYNNPFIRSYPVHAAEFIYEIDLKFNSYYFAGSDEKKVYLGNYTNPSQVLVIDNKSRQIKKVRILFNPDKILFKNVTISVRDSSFYLFDGSVPKYFQGSLKNWKINNEFNGFPYFTKAVPLDDVSAVFRSNNAKNSANVLGIYNASDESGKIRYKRDLLERQTDGIFDTDGMLMYSSKLEKIVYLYYYRNEFIIADKLGSLSYRGHTIDTIKNVKIKTASLKNDTERTISSPVYIVNAHSAIYKNLLFVNSKIRGRNEIDKLWERSSIIDLYDIKTNKYLLSFPVYHIGKKGLRSLTITEENLYALIGKTLVVYKFSDIIKKEILSH
ncbi:hypothetical protein K6T82_03530 [Flavobacterium sp. 17A]|uniref:Methylamine utilisation protein MauE domain-containing protein n=1 Tax=Flavobacterium potami TaxID=2872310 RepID=A0A9X1H804_9FLAO|nr:MauE/DoxX family redox-associated membrane protein [Flavobacterium potami]MBZ4033822.1 hypothetical protein [Flavobacterium potami]